MHLNDLARILRVIGDKNRLRILCVIFNTRNICVSDIAKELGLSVAIVSHHLKVMSGDDLILPVRTGKRICYKLPAGTLMKDIKRFICKYEK